MASVFQIRLHRFRFSRGQVCGRAVYDQTVTIRRDFSICQKIQRIHHHIGLFHRISQPGIQFRFSVALQSICCDHFTGSHILNCRCQCPFPVEGSRLYIPFRIGIVIFTFIDIVIIHISGPLTACHHQTVGVSTGAGVLIYEIRIFHRIDLLHLHMVRQIHVMLQQMQHCLILTSLLHNIVYGQILLQLADDFLRLLRDGVYAGRGGIQGDVFFRQSTHAQVQNQKQGNDDSRGYGGISSQPDILLRRQRL